MASAADESTLNEWDTVVTPIFSVVINHLTITADLEAQLIEKRLIGYNDLQAIKAEKTDFDKKMLLLQTYLYTRGPGSLGHFIDALKRAENEYLAKILEERRERINRSEEREDEREGEMHEAIQSLFARTEETVTEIQQLKRQNEKTKTEIEKLKRQNVTVIYIHCKERAVPFIQEEFESKPRSGSTMQIFVRGSHRNNSTHTTTYSVPTNCYVSDFMKLIEERMEVPPAEQVLIHAGKQLESSRLLSSYTELNNDSIVHLIFCLHGSGFEPKSKTERPNLTKKMLSDKEEKDTEMSCGKERQRLKLTKEECIIMGGDDDTEWRIEMSCGDPVGSALDDYCHYEVFYKDKYEFRCPSRECKKEWSFGEVRRSARPSKTSKKDYEIRLNENCMKNGLKTKECPKCKNFCVRGNQSDVRVICGYCSRQSQSVGLYEFCWSCLHEWTNKGSRTVCGNVACSKGFGSRFLLQNSHLTSSDSCFKQLLPKYRACTSCQQLIEHVGGCPSMTCISCQTTFCFKCLEQGCSGRECSTAPCQAH